jgi:hypothetical protein
MHAGMDLERIGKIKWWKEVINHLGKGVQAWKICNTDNITALVIVLLVSIFKTIIFDE